MKPIIADETRGIIHEFIDTIRVSIEEGINEDYEPNDPSYGVISSVAYKEAIRYAVEMLSKLEQEHCN